MGLQILRSPVRIRLSPILVGVVGNISACHADARGSIPRLGVFFLFFLLIFAKKKQKRTPSRGIEPRASAWQAEMLPTTPTRIHIKHNFWNFTSFIKKKIWRKKSIKIFYLLWSNHGFPKYCNMGAMSDFLRGKPTKNVYAKEITLIIWRTLGPRTRD